jgi:hypothetical protein
MVDASSSRAKPTFHPKNTTLHLSSSLFPLLFFELFLYKLISPQTNKHYKLNWTRIFSTKSSGSRRNKQSESFSHGGLSHGFWSLVQLSLAKFISIQNWMNEWIHKCVKEWNFSFVWVGWVNIWFGVTLDYFKIFHFIMTAR